MPINITQSSINNSATGNPLTATAALTGVAAGAALLAIVSYSSTSTREFSATDNIEGSWPAEYSGYTAQGTRYFLFPNHTGGNVTVSVTHGSSTAGFSVHLLELAGFSASATFSAYGDWKSGSNVTSQQSVDDIEAFSIGEACILLLGGNTGTSFSNATLDSGWVEIHDNGFSLVGYKIFESGCSGEKGLWTCSTGRAPANNMIAITGVAISAPEYVPTRVSDVKLNSIIH